MPLPHAELFLLKIDLELGDVMAQLVRQNSFEKLKELMLQILELNFFLDFEGYFSGQNT